MGIPRWSHRKRTEPSLNLSVSKVIWVIGWNLLRMGSHRVMGEAVSMIGVVVRATKEGVGIRSAASRVRVPPVAPCFDESEAY